MLRLLTNKIFILVSFIVLIFVLILATSGETGGANVVRNVLSVPLSPLQRAFTLVIDKVDGLVSHFRNVRDTQQENLSLIIRVNELEQQLSELEELQKKNIELRDALAFRDLYDDYKVIGGNIIAKDPGNWFEVFTIDQGAQSGVQVDATIATPYGLVGRVSRVDAFTSRVVALIDMDSRVSVRVARTRDLLVLRGDVKLRLEGLCRVDYIPPNSDIQPGDVLETSGLGGIYPKGIRIGTVENVLSNEGQYDSYAIVRPSVDFKRLEEVLVMIGTTKEIGEN